MKESLTCQNEYLFAPESLFSQKQNCGDLEKNKLTEYDKFKLIRPIYEHKIDEQNMPIINSISEKEIFTENARPVNIQNLRKNTNNADKIVLFFRYDKYLEKYWNDPLKYTILLSGAMAVCTPDFSIYPSMNKNEIAFNVYKNRWLGCLWQNCGCKVIPTISWAKKDTYDICFSGIEKGGIVMISTIGCKNNIKDFLDGFFEMQKRLEPSLILVFGDMIKGMKGRFIDYRYNEAFDKKTEQISLFDIPPIFEI